MQVEALAARLSAFIERWTGSWGGRPGDATSMRNIIVVGAGGFLGSRIVAELLSRGHRVTCAGRDPAALQRRFPSCRAVELELSRITIAHWVTQLAGTDAVVKTIYVDVGVTPCPGVEAGG
jgi:NAD(P)-dependent dehydrogenase (short-subunit alcohol dehydrogenase family)